MASFKTNWKSSDGLTASQFNRIIANLREINSIAISTAGVGNATLQSYITTISGYSANNNTVYLASWFNNIEKNVSLLAEILGLSFSSVTFYPNGQFIKWSELNRLETEMMQLYRLYSDIIEHATRIPFTLGIRQIF